MATKENIKRVVKKVSNKVWSVLCWLGRLLEKVGKGIIIGVFTPVVVLILFLLFNPLVLFFRALIAPKKTAEIFSNAANEQDFFNKFTEAIGRPAITFLPWYAKKAFIAELGAGDFSIKAQVRYFKEADDKKKVACGLDSKAKDILWKTTEYREILAETMALNDEQFKSLITNEEFNVIKKVVKNNSLSENKIAMLLSSAWSHDEERSLEILKFCIKRDGLSSRLVSLVYDQFSDLAIEISEALNVCAQRRMTLNVQNYNGDKESWKKFCDNTEVICEEAQKLMTYWQYEIYHKAGKQLSERTIAYFLSKGDTTMAGKIFAYEPDHGVQSEEIKAIIKANLRLSKCLLKIV